MQKSDGTIAIAIGGEVFRDIGGWYWPMTDIAAWACENEFRALGHSAWAEQVNRARTQAEQQRMQ